MDGVDVWECFGRSLEVWSQQMMNSAGGEEGREGESAERVYSEDRRIWCQIGSMMKGKTVKNVASMYGRLECRIPSQGLVFTVD